jgi:hypothetical protein
LRPDGFYRDRGRDPDVDLAYVALPLRVAAVDVWFWIDAMPKKMPPSRVALHRQGEKEGADNLKVVPTK